MKESGPGLISIPAASGGEVYIFSLDGLHLRTLDALTAVTRFEFAYDTDSKQSANTRVRVLDMLAANRIPLIAYHFPWPGVGHVAKNGDGFRYFPAALQMMELKA